MRKGWMAAVGGLVAAAVVASMAVAQQPAPTIGVTASPTSVAAQVTGPVAAGPTRFRVTRAAARTDLTVYFALLMPGVTLQELQTTLRRDDRTGGSASLGLVSVQASASLAGGETSRDVVFPLRAGVTYVLVSEVGTEGEDPTPSRAFSTFATSGAANGASAGAADATIRMVDLRFRGDRVLPRRGTVRVRNLGAVPHFAIAFPLRRGTTSAQVGRALRSNSERALGRVIRGEPAFVQGLISGGGTSNDQTVRFPRAGRYALVCFFNEHHRLGMYRVVRVR